MGKIIIPTGYMGSGSSAVTDLVAEFQGCKNEYKSYEYVLLHCPEGLFDLEDKLLRGNNAIRSDEAIRSFRAQMQKLYNKKFWWVGNYQKIIGPQFMAATDRYVEALTNFQYPGYWYYQEEVNFKMFCRLLVQKPFKMLSRHKERFPKVLRYQDGMRICLPTEEEFYQASRNYLEEVLQMIGGTDDNLVLDQFLLPFNLFRIDRYFDDSARCIVVDRDPRDVFILNKYIWGEKKIGVPMPKEAQMFCSYYRRMRESEKPCNSGKVLRIHFEDLIYRYEETLEKIMQHLDFTPDMHIEKKMRFDPALSGKNTQLFHADQYAGERKILEEQLSEYLYDFPEYRDNSLENTLEFD